MAQEPQGAYEQFEYVSLDGCLYFCAQRNLSFAVCSMEVVQFGQC